MIAAAVAMAFLSIPSAKTAIGHYEARYWHARHIPAVTSEPACRRRSKTMVVCVAYTRIVSPGRLLYVTTKDAVRLVGHGKVLKVVPGKSGLFDEEQTMPPSASTADVDEPVAEEQSAEAEIETPAEPVSGAAEEAAVLEELAAG